MKILAGVCDGARSWDDRGFNKYDTAFGKTLAHLPTLTKGQGRAALKLARKYQRQLPANVLTGCGIKG